MIPAAIIAGLTLAATVGYALIIRGALRAAVQDGREIAKRVIEVRDAEAELDFKRQFKKGHTEQ